MFTGNFDFPQNWHELGEISKIDLLFEVSLTCNFNFTCLGKE